MISKIFQSILLVAVVVLISSTLIITGVLYQYFGTTQEALLKDELRFAATATNRLGRDYLKELNTERYRLTLVNPDGIVIYDSHSDISIMENHSDREEIKEAMISGTGNSIRHSSTLTEQTIYQAVRLDNGNILRISVSRASSLLLLLGMLPPAAVVFLISLSLSAWLAKRMAQRVVEPLNMLNLDKPMENDSYEEVSALLHRIHAQHIEIKEQIENAKRKEKEFDEITSNMKEALVLLDNTGRILSINPAAKLLFETKNSCIGEDFMTIYRKSDICVALEEARRKGSATFRAGKNGKEYQFDLNRIDSGDKNHGIVILAYDITEQVNAEKHRREFTANISHELKTPLQTIIGSAELMENGIVKKEDLPRFIGHIRKEASRLITLINDIIRLSQLDERTELPHEDISINQIAQEVIDNLSDAAALKKISLVLTGDEGKMYGVQRLLYEIIYNICDNGIKYTPAGGNVTISITQKEDNVMLSIRDNGIGISPKNHDKIFERFYRVDKSHSKNSGGTGLGLSIVKHAVQYHHGTIALESELNKGTTITIIFNTKKGADCNSSPQDQSPC